MRILRLSWLVPCGLLLALTGFAGPPEPTTLRAATHPDFEADAGSGSDSTAADTSAAGKEKDTPWVVSAAHGPADTVRFETDEGTWMSLDVTPDGKTLVFDLLGDLYTLPVTGGRAVRITSGPAYDVQPRFSPDGARILFTSDRGGSNNLWTVAADGSDPRPITADPAHPINSGDWTPDGQYVVARRRITDASPIGTVELWLYHTLGGSGVQITKKDALPDANGPVVSPDGRWIYYAARHRRYQYDANVFQGYWQIEGYDRETGNIRMFTDGYGGSGKPAISPDGTTLSFIRRDRARTILVLHTLATGRERVLFEGLDPDLQEGFAWTGTYPGYSWTPDGKGILITFGGGIHRLDVATGADTPIPFTAAVEQHVTRALRFPQEIAPDTFPVRMVSWPNQSPSGKDLVFSALGRLYRMPLPSGTVTALPAEGPRSYAPAFDAKRNRIAYVSWSDRDGGHVWVMDLDGRRSTRVTQVPGQYANPVFSPDGSRIAFLAGSGATARGRDLGEELWLEVRWAPASGGPATFVVSTENRGSSRKMPRLSWSPDGTRIYFDEDQGNGDASRTVLVSIRPDGTDRQEHVKIKYAEEILPSPDGQWVLYSALHQGYLAALPTLGKEPIELGGDSGPLPAYRFSREGADWLNWADRGKTITWGFGPAFYRVSLDSVRASWAASQMKAAAKANPAPPDSSTADKKKEDENAVHPDTIRVELVVPRAKPKGTVAYTGARLITMNGDTVIPRGTLVVENDRIVAVGAEDAVTVPAGAKVVDVAGKTILPGFVDVHAHLHYSYLDIIPETIDSYYANLAYGVTTTHDPSASTYAVFTQHEMVEAGITVGPRIFSTGFILYGADIPNTAPIDNLEDARRHIRRLKHLGAFSVKSYMQPRREQRQWVIEAAREESVMVVPEGGGDLDLNMSMVLDGHTGIEHALPVAPIYQDVVTLMARSGTGYTPTLLVAYGGLSGEHWFYQHYEVWQDAKLLRYTPRGQLDARARRRPVMTTDDDWHYQKVAAGAKAIVEAGGGVQLGGHGQLQGLGPHWELWGFVQGGMSNQDALRVATLLGAQYLGLDGSIGSLEPGKLADFMVLDANPLEDIHNSNTLHYVVKNGELFETDTMREVWPRERERPPFPWEVQGAMLGRIGEGPGR